MKKAVKSYGYFVLIGLSFLIMSCGGGDDEGGGGIFHCTYTKTTYYSGSGCSSPSETVTECVQENADNIRDDWTPEYYCSQVYGGNSNYCSATCCVDTYYTDTTYGAGACPAALTNSLSAVSSDLVYKLSWNGYADLNLSASTPEKNEVSSESGLVDGCQHTGNNQGFEAFNSEEIICGQDANLKAEYLLIITSYSSEDIQYKLEVMSENQVIQSFEGSLDPTQPEKVIPSKL